MRLLDTNTLELHNFVGNALPPYAILSHVWGEEEVSFTDMMTPGCVHLRGWGKVVRCAKHAASEGWGYVWIDTCCIDKRDSSELSEAINSMFRWYEQAAVCYAYLEDVEVSQATFNQSFTSHARSWNFLGSRWFRRGWTLQELLAPAFVVFLDRNWQMMGTREDRIAEIGQATGIEADYLVDFDKAPVATKFSWAARRQTTRVEDRAYSLLGLFGIHMPLIYGEGDAAFRRLQLEIIQVLDDETLFVWQRANGATVNTDLLAPSPDSFKDCNDLFPHRFDTSRTGFSLSNRGLAIRTALWENSDIGSQYLLPLNCYRQTHHKTRLQQVLPLRKSATIPSNYDVDRSATFMSRSGIDVSETDPEWFVLNGYFFERRGLEDIYVSLKASEDDAKRGRHGQFVPFCISFICPPCIDIYSVRTQRLTTLPHAKMVHLTEVFGGSDFVNGLESTDYPVLSEEDVLVTKIATSLEGVAHHFLITVSWPGRIPLCGIRQLHDGVLNNDEALNCVRDWAGKSSLPHTASLESGFERITIQLLPRPLRPGIVLRDMAETTPNFQVRFRMLTLEIKLGKAPMTGMSAPAVFGI